MFLSLFTFLIFTLLGGCGDANDDLDGDGFVNCHEATKKWPRYRDPYGCFEEQPEWHEDPNDPDAPMATPYIYGSFNPAVHDCNDGDPETNPGSEEVCDGIDNDCDGLWDEGDADELSNDCDNDGFVALDLYEELDDCDPWDAAVYPGAPEIPDDGRDNDCDGCADEVDDLCPPEDTGGRISTGCQCSTIVTAVPVDPGCRCDTRSLADSGCFCDGRGGISPLIMLPLIGYVMRRKHRK